MMAKHFYITENIEITDNNANNDHTFVCLENPART